MIQAIKAHPDSPTERMKRAGIQTIYGVELEGERGLQTVLEHKGKRVKRPDHATHIERYCLKHFGIEIEKDPTDEQTSGKVAQQL